MGLHPSSPLPNGTDEPPSLDAYPLPLAVLLRRALLAKSPRQLHDYAFSAWDVSVRLHVFADERAHDSLREPSLGSWVCAGEWPAEATLNDPELRSVVELFAREANASPARGRLSPSRVVEHLAAYRNNVIGHGSPRVDAYYSSAGHTLLEGIRVAWARSLFWPAGARLVFVDADGSTLSLMGCVPMPSTRLSMPPGNAEICLQQGEATRSLHPWLLLDRSAPRERVLVFNGSNRSGPSYLDFDAGMTLRGARLSQAVGPVADPVRASTPEEGRTTPVVPESGIDDLIRVGRLGEGGMGLVELARNASTGGLVAVKRLPPGPSADEDLQRQLAREIKALFRCDHPHIVRLLAYGEDLSSAPYFTMEFIEGPPLSLVIERLRRGDEFPAAIDHVWAAMLEKVVALRAVVAPREGERASGEDATKMALEAFVQAARALCHLHELRVLHGDISPGNVLIAASSRRVVLIDFGLARLKDATAPQSTRAGPRGTVRTMAPELRGGSPLDERADIYSLAATFQGVFFEGDAGPEGQRHFGSTRARRAPFPWVEPAIGEALERVFERALAPRPHSRHASAEELLADLLAIQAGRQPSPEPRRWRSSKVVVAGAFLTGSILVATLAARVRPLPTLAPSKGEITALQAEGSSASPAAMTPVSKKPDWTWSDRCEKELNAGALDAARATCNQGLERDTGTEPSLHYNLARIEEKRGDIKAAREHLARSLKLRPHPEVQAAARRICERSSGAGPQQARWHLVGWEARQPGDLAVVRDEGGFQGREIERLELGACVWVSEPPAGNGAWAHIHYRSPAPDGQLREGYMHVDLLAPRPSAASAPSCPSACCGGAACRASELNARTLPALCGAGGATCSACPSGAACVPGDCAEQVPPGTRLQVRLGGVFHDETRPLADEPAYESLLVCVSGPAPRGKERCVPLARTRAEPHGVPLDVELSAEQLLAGELAITLKEVVGREQRASWGTHKRPWRQLPMRDLCLGHAVTLDRAPFRKTEVLLYLEPWSG